jgi:hypothetical protein
MVSQLLVLVASFVALNNGGNPQGPLAKADVSKGVPQQVGDISGYYTCKGVEASGKPYSGVAVVVKKNDVYLVQWMVGGGSTFSGVAIRQGDTFAASWAMPSDRGIIRGVNLYRIESGPRLVGRWASSPGPGLVQNETLTFLKKLDHDED